MCVGGAMMCMTFGLMLRYTDTLKTDLRQWVVPTLRKTVHKSGLVNSVKLDKVLKMLNGWAASLSVCSADVMLLFI